MSVFSSDVSGQYDGERAAVSSAFGGDCAAVGFGNAPNNGQAEAVAAGVGTGRIDAKEAVKDKRQIFRGDPDAGVGDPQAAASRVFGGGERNRAARRRVDNRVFH